MGASGAMKLLFVSGVSVGGAPRSTVDLATSMADRGHDITILFGRDRPVPRLFDLGVRAWVKLEPRPGSALLLSALRRVGRVHRPSPTWSSVAPGVRVLEARAPENALLPLIDDVQPDAVVVNSLPRAQMRWTEAELRRAGIPMVLYLREAHSVTHLTVSRLTPDLLVSNAQSFADELATQGYACEVVPSLIDFDRSDVDSTRQVALLVNPVGENRPAMIADMARARPDIPFVLQESWPLTPEERAQLEADVADLPNVEVRGRSASPADVFRDARVLLATYPSGRARVVTEAQHNGIPVIAANQPQLAEALGDAGVLVDPAAPMEIWLASLSELWDDAGRYDAAARAAYEHARRSDIDPDEITSRFEAALASLVTGAR